MLMIIFFGSFSENATMSDWSPFTTCSASCGGGVKTRNRTCNSSRFGGKDCSAPGQLSEKQPCNVHDCNGEIFEMVRSTIHSCHRHPFSKCPDFSLIKNKISLTKEMQNVSSSSAVILNPFIKSNNFQESFLPQKYR